MLTPADLEGFCGNPVRLTTPEAQRDNLGPDHTCSRRFASGEALLTLGMFLHDTEQQAAESLARVPPAVIGVVLALPHIGQRARRYTFKPTGNSETVLKVEFQQGRISGFISAWGPLPMCSIRELNELARMVAERLPAPTEQSAPRPEEPKLIASLPATGPERLYMLPGLTCDAVVTDQDVKAACGGPKTKALSLQPGLRVTAGASCKVGLNATNVIGPFVTLDNFGSILAAKESFEHPYRAGVGLTKVSQLTDLGNQAHIGTLTGMEGEPARELMVRLGNVVVKVSTTPIAGLPVLCSDDGMVKLAKRIVGRLK